MAATLPMEGVDFRYLIIEYYKKLGLTEAELSVLLMINHLLNQKNDWITADMLSMKMNFKTKDIDATLAKMVTKSYLEYVPDKTDPTKWRTSLEPLSKILWANFSSDVAKSNQNRYDADRAGDLSALYGYFEKRLNKTLSPFDKDAINTWLDDGYRVSQIRDALEESLANGKKTMKSIGKVLRMARAGEDIAHEGITAVSEAWDKSIEETLEIVNTKWVNTDEDGR